MSVLGLVGEQQLLERVERERWFQSKGRAEAARVVAVPYEDDDLALALVEVGLRGGTSETYLLTLGRDGDDVVEALDRPDLAARIAALCGVETPGDTVAPIGVEQSNSSVVLDGRHVLKVYRRLEPGPNLEIEVLAALRQLGFERAPTLHGALEHAGEVMEASLAAVTEKLDVVGGGWELTLDGLAGGDPDWLPRRALRLGEVTGELHSALVSALDPALAPTPASAEAVPLLVATIDEEIGRLADEVPDSPLAGRVENVRDLLQSLSGVGPPGLAIRVHGDYHLGQVMWTQAGDWAVIDFEGEPGRSFADRRRRTFGLRDVAGMTRSFAYAADGVRLLRGVDAPPGWEQSCRSSFLAGYRATVDERVLPASESGFERLLTLFELQKLLYELRYELGNRPSWTGIPLAGLERMMGAA